MNRIGIIGAMELEVEELKSQMEEVTVKEKASIPVKGRKLKFVQPPVTAYHHMSSLNAGNAARPT